MRSTRVPYRDRDQTSKFKDDACISSAADGRAEMSGVDGEKKNDIISLL